MNVWSISSLSVAVAPRSFLVLLTLAFTSSLRLPAFDSGAFRGAPSGGSDALPWSSTSPTPVNQTTAVGPPGGAARLPGDRRRQVIRGEREAAVITRLPQMKTEICRAERLEQTIRERGCLPRTIVNRYCYGQCNSFFIPRAATLSVTTSHHRRQPAVLQSVSPLATASTLLVTGSDHVQAGQARRRPIRAGSTSAPEVPLSSPSTSPEGAAELQWLAFKSCSFCRPKRVAWITVGLTCPRRRPAYRRRRIQIVKECSCTALTLD